MTRFPVVSTFVLAAVLPLVGAVAWGSDALADAGAPTTQVECGILLPGILPEGQVLSTVGDLVVSPGGTATLVCRGQLPPALAPASAVIITDLDCALDEGGQVAESHVRVTPSGAVLLVCHNNPGSEPFDPGPGD